MKTRTTLRVGAAIIAVAAGVFALSGSAGAGPKAQHIAYTSMFDGQADIYSMDADGLLPQINLTHDKTFGVRQDVEPTWSPDGVYVAFQRNFMGAVTSPPSSALYLVTTDGKKLRRLTPPATQEGVFDTHPTWSRDGGMAVFSSTRDGNYELYAIKASGRGLTKLTNTKPWVQNLEPAWSPDGRTIVFVRRTTTLVPTPAALFALDLSTGRVSQLTAPKTGRGDRDPAWSPKGGQIAFTSDRMGSNDIFMVNSNGKALRQLTQKKSNDNHPSWAPAADTLVFVSDRTGATEIFALELPSSTRDPGEKVRQLTFDKAFKANPTWEPAGVIGPAPTH